MFGEIMFAIGKIIFSIKTSVYLLESLIENYFDLSGKFCENDEHICILINFIIYLFLR